MNARAAEKLVQYGAAWVAIGEALKTASLMKRKNLELAAIFENTNKQAAGLVKLQVTEDESLQDLKHPLKALKIVAEQLLESGTRLENHVVYLMVEAGKLDKFLKEKVPRTAVPSEFLSEFCKALDDVCQMAQAFYEEFIVFTEHLNNIVRQATEVTDLLKKMEENAIRNKGVKVTLSGAAIGAAGLLALTFFTGGAALVAAGVAVVGGACAAGGTMAAITGSSFFSSFSTLASGVQADAGKLKAIADELKRVGEKAGEFKLDPKAKAALEEALTFFQNELEKDDMRAKMEADNAKMAVEITKRDTEIARRDAERDAENARKDAEIARRDAEIARKDAEIARRDAERDAENARKDAERDAEIARKDAERDAENARKDAEIARRDAEIARRDAAIARAQAEREELIAKLRALSQ